MLSFLTELYSIWYSLWAVCLATPKSLCNSRTNLRFVKADNSFYHNPKDCSSVTQSAFSRILQTLLRKMFTFEYYSLVWNYIRNWEFKHNCQKYFKCLDFSFQKSFRITELVFPSIGRCVSVGFSFCEGCI